MKSYRYLYHDSAITKSRSIIYQKEKFRCEISTLTLNLQDQPTNRSITADILRRFSFQLLNLKNYCFTQFAEVEAEMNEEALLSPKAEAATKMSSADNKPPLPVHRSGFSPVQKHKGKQKRMKNL